MKDKYEFLWIVLIAVGISAWFLIDMARSTEQRSRDANELSYKVAEALHKSEKEGRRPTDVVSYM